MVGREQLTIESSFPVAKCQPGGYDRSQGDEDYDTDGDVLLHGAFGILRVRAWVWMGWIWGVAHLSSLGL